MPRAMTCCKRPGASKRGPRGINQLDIERLVKLHRPLSSGWMGWKRPALRTPLAYALADRFKDVDFGASLAAVIG